MSICTTGDSSCSSSSDCASSAEKPEKKLPPATGRVGTAVITTPPACEPENSVASPRPSSGASGAAPCPVEAAGELALGAAVTAAGSATDADHNKQPIPLMPPPPPPLCSRTR